MATPGKRDLDVYQGDDHSWAMRMTRPPVNNVREPIVLTGYVFRAQVRARNADADAGGAPLATFTVTVTDAAQGMFQVDLPAAESVKLTANCKWDLEMEHVSSGDKRTVLTGDVLVTKEVTRVAP